MPYYRVDITGISTWFRQVRGMLRVAISPVVFDVVSICTRFSKPRSLQRAVLVLRGLRQGASERAQTLAASAANCKTANWVARRMGRLTARRSSAPALISYCLNAGQHTGIFFDHPEYPCHARLAQYDCRPLAVSAGRLTSRSDTSPGLWRTGLTTEFISVTRMQQPLHGLWFAPMNNPYCPAALG